MSYSILNECDTDDLPPTLEPPSPPSEEEEEEPQSGEEMECRADPPKGNSELNIIPRVENEQNKPKKKKKKKKKKRKSVPPLKEMPPLDITSFKQKQETYFTKKTTEIEYFALKAFFDEFEEIFEKLPNYSTQKQEEIVQTLTEVAVINGNLVKLNKIILNYPHYIKSMAMINFILQVGISHWNLEIIKISFSMLELEKKKEIDLIYLKQIEIPDSFKSPEYLKQSVGFFQKYQKQYLQYEKNKYLRNDNNNNEISILLYLIENSKSFSSCLKSNFNAILQFYCTKCYGYNILQKDLYKVWRLILKFDLKFELETCICLRGECTESPILEIIVELQRIVFMPSFSPPIECIQFLLQSKWIISDRSFLANLAVTILSFPSLHCTIEFIPKFVFHEFAFRMIDHASSLPSGDFQNVFNYLYDNNYLHNENELKNYSFSKLARAGFVDAMIKLYDLGNCNLSLIDNENYSPLMRSVEQCDLITSNWLIENSCDLTYYHPETHENPLSIACEVNDDQFLKSLLKSMWIQSQKIKKPIFYNLIKISPQYGKNKSFPPKLINEYVNKEKIKLSSNQNSFHSKKSKQKRTKNKRKINKYKIIHNNNHNQCNNNQYNKQQSSKMNSKSLKDKLNEKLININEIMNSLDTKLLKRKINENNNHEIIKNEEFIKEKEEINKNEEPNQDFIQFQCNTIQIDDINHKIDDDNKEDVDFSKLKWEIVLTDKAKRQWEALDTIHRMQVKKSLLRIAEGYRSISVSKKLTGVPNTLKLYESKFSSGGRILWEEAVDFSYRFNEPIYTDIIRVWFVVLNHDKLQNYVQKCIKSHEIGISGRITRDMIPNKLYTDSKSSRSAIVEPNIYTNKEEHINHQKSSSSSSSSFQFPVFPPASYHSHSCTIEKFYSLSENLLDNIIQSQSNQNSSVSSSSAFQFPFRISEIEFEIIKQSTIENQSTILLGRSGTGKTTCALYKLWFEYESYWKSTNPSNPLCYNNKNENSYSHLNQIFITANPILRSEVKKIFHSLKVNNLKNLSFPLFFNENDDDNHLFPLSLKNNIDYRHFPLFLTSREWILMLSSSLKNSFFNNNSIIEKKFQNYQNDENRTILSSLHFLKSQSTFSSNSMDCHDNNLSQDDNDHDNSFIPHVEIDYEYFHCIIWPQIKPSGFSHHSSLIFTEIYSFIKGSIESLQTENGYLSRKDYIHLGKKRSNIFISETDRNEIYSIFETYEQYKKNNRYDIHLFDWMDVIFHCYKELSNENSYKGISIHSLVHDEVQDATQAELALYFKICDPNKLFFTGDTCQTIARGINFRFCDLRSLFHYSHCNNDTIIIPPISHLTVNFRSHASITNLACSIVELIKFFNPFSFDSELPRDQGILEGNFPLLLDSIDIDNLYYLLFGKNRLHVDEIEFGADQVIIVKNQAAKENLPDFLKKEALCLTVFESKGLEFNDVLLFNFFSDSKLDQPWKAINDYNDEYFATFDSTSDDNSKHIIKNDHFSYQNSNSPSNTTILSGNTKILAQELKFFYTAVTRARENIWIYDDNKKLRKPMFDFLIRRNLAHLVNKNTSAIEESKAVKSSPKEWEIRGNNLLEKQLYSLAAQCFAKSGNLSKEKFCRAFSLTQDAFNESNSFQQKILYLDAALLYLECESFKEAATCLFEAECYAHAEKLFFALGDTQAYEICQSKSGTIQ